MGRMGPQWHGKCSPAAKPLEQKWLLENAAVLTEMPKSLMVAGRKLANPHYRLICIDSRPVFYECFPFMLPYNALH